MMRSMEDIQELIIQWNTSHPLGITTEEKRKREKEKKRKREKEKKRKREKREKREKEKKEKEKKEKEKKEKENFLLSSQFRSNLIVRVTLSWMKVEYPQELSSFKNHDLV